MSPRKLGALAAFAALLAVPALAQTGSPAPGTNAPSASTTAPRTTPPVAGVPGAAVPGMVHQGQPAGHMAGQAPITGGSPGPVAGTGNTP